MVLVDTSVWVLHLTCNGLKGSRWLSLTLSSLNKMAFGSQRHNGIEQLS